MAGSIYRLQGTESRKGNISFSLDTQNATSVGGHRLQTEISSHICSWGTEAEGGEREWEIKRETRRQENSIRYLILAQSNMEKDCRLKDQIGRDHNGGKKIKKSKTNGSSPTNIVHAKEACRGFYHLEIREGSQSEKYVDFTMSWLGHSSCKCNVWSCPPKTVTHPVPHLAHSHISHLNFLTSEKCSVCVTERALVRIPCSVRISAPKHNNVSLCQTVFTALFWGFLLKRLSSHQMWKFAS